MGDNCSVLDPWLFRNEPWMSEALARENEALTKALQISLSDSSSSGGTAAAAAPIASPDTISAATSSFPFLLHHQFAPPPVAVVEGGRRQNPVGFSPSGKISKRKSRSSKRSPTMYINADPANFREMVQQVTGVGFDGKAAMPFETVFKPEPHRPTMANRAVLQQTRLPTLDTSAFFLDQATIRPATDGSIGPVSVNEPVFDFDALLPGFPTLESWGVM